jgi:lipoprotein-anchoring transpeptidase ErfK/SrfK
MLLAGLASAPLAACNTAQRASIQPDMDPDIAGWYIGYAPDEPHNIPLVDRSKMDAKFARQTVAYNGPERAGTVVVDIDSRFLYYVNGDGTAIRYGAGVGRQGFSWRGTATVGRKAVWPDWRPTPTMMRIKPELPSFVEAGIDNPLGARAMYLYQDGRDILFRIHGTNEPWSIGEQVSSGCIRLLNEDVADLYSRVTIGTTVHVKRNGVYRV